MGRGTFIGGGPLLGVLQYLKGESPKKVLEAKSLSLELKIFFKLTSLGLKAQEGQLGKF